MIHSAPEASATSLDLGEQVGADGNAGLEARGGDAALGIAGDHHGLGRIGRPGGAQRVAEGGDVGAEVGGVAEHAGIHRQHEVADVHAGRASWCASGRSPWCRPTAPRTGCSPWRRGRSPCGCCPPGVPPSGVMKPPLLTSRGSVLGSPSVVTSQPGGVGRFSLALLRILPAATVVVAMSSRNGSPGRPGAAKAIGSVPSRACAPIGRRHLDAARRGRDHADQGRPRPPSAHRSRRRRNAPSCAPPRRRCRTSSPCRWRVPWRAERWRWPRPPLAVDQRRHRCFP